LLSFGVAHGLALQGLNASCIHTNLLPPEIAKERAIKAKKPWAVAAAAVLLLITPPLLLGWAASKASWTNEGVKKASNELTKVVNSAKGDVSNYSMHETSLKATQQDIKKLAGGVDERLNWYALNSYINAALPRPDGTHVVKAARDGSRPYEKYYDAAAKKAAVRWEELKAKKAETGELTPDEQKELEEVVKKHLVEVNIEAVTALYTDKVATEAALLFVQGNKTPILPATGWVIEIRGYTYNQGQEVFVRNTIVENLMDLADVDQGNRDRLTDVKLPKEVEAALRDKDSNGNDISRLYAVVLYNNTTVPNPQPGMFSLIGRTLSATRLHVSGLPGVVKDDTGKKSASSFGNLKGLSFQQLTRNTWRPAINSVMAESFGVTTAPGQLRLIPPQPLDLTTHKAPRTEFVIFLFWQEQITGVQATGVQRP
jgi:hypothetical protein